VSDEQNFLSRWARRKNQHRQETQAAASPVEKPASELEQAVQPSLPDAPLSAVECTEEGMRSAVAAPSMEDVASLTKDSDFAPFVAKNATQLVKNAALKKLFSDPHFNIMDRLDIYIDDYGQPDPLPDGWLDKLEHAKGWLTPTDAQRAAAAQEAAVQSDAATHMLISETEPAVPEAAPKNECDADPLDISGSAPKS